MSKLQLKDVKIEFPNDFKSDFTEANLVEWLEWELGARSDIKLDNPLLQFDLSECNVSIGELIIDGKNHKL